MILEIFSQFLKHPFDISIPGCDNKNSTISRLFFPAEIFKDETLQN